MKFACEKYMLSLAVATAGRAAASKSPIPALEGLLVEANANVRITGYDLKKGIYTSFDADVSVPGSVVLSAKLFGDIVRKLPDGIVTVSSDEYNAVNIKCGNADYNISGNSAEDNGAGVYTDKPIEVVYHYKPADSIVAPQVDSSYNSRANVIYMGSDGEILDVKTYLGVEGDPVEVEELEFKGYKFHGKSDNYATFSIFEANIIVNYEKQVFNWLPIIIIGGVALILIGAVVFYFIGRDKRKKIESIEIEEF